MCYCFRAQTCKCFSINLDPLYWLLSKLCNASGRTWFGVQCIVISCFYSLPTAYFFMLFSSADFFQNQSFNKILSGIPSECQTVRILIRSDVLSDFCL